MRLSSGIDQLQSENAFLKRVIICLFIAAPVIFMAMAVVIMRPPMIVERTSHGLEIVRNTEFSPTENDIKVAIDLMMKSRFNTDAVAPEIFLNKTQLALRDAEQKDLKSRNLFQSVIVRGIYITKDQAVVELDRVISVGEIRSALKAKVKITFEETSPNELNPYGLLLSLAEPIENEGKK